MEQHGGKKGTAAGAFPGIYVSKCRVQLHLLVQLNAVDAGLFRVMHRL
ncbi:hypothetical protein ACFYU5_04645 [Nocardia aobensis]|uniref:Uncharacterized protein n=1 Tax=Nocardia aobensis TaxID=257277 RepID=A0ABW6NWW3_9NOCA